MYLLIHREEVELVPQFLFYSGKRELHQLSVTKVATAKDWEQSTLYHGL